MCLNVLDMELVFILSPLLSYNKMNRRYTKSRNLHMGTLLTGYALVPYALMIFVCGDSVAANPIQMVGTPVGGFKMCDETADCDVDKEYCDVNINRCGPCSVLCDEDRGLQNECLTHCRGTTIHMYIAVCVVFDEVYGCYLVYLCLTVLSSQDVIQYI